MKQSNLSAKEFEYRRTLLKIILLIIIIVGSIFSVHNWTVGLSTLAIAEFVAVCLALGILSIHKTTTNINFWSASFLILLYSIIVFGVYSSLFVASLYSWLFLIPVLSYLLLGLKIGTILTATFVSSGILVLYFTHTHNNTSAPFISTLNISFTMAAIWGLSYTYEYKRASMVKQLQDAAALDPLTKLYNRLNLESFFSTLCKNCKNRDDKVAVLLLDLDHFKKVNDRYGHITGDKVLQEVAIRIKRLSSKNDRAFRLGGEEFCLLIPNTSNQLTGKTAEDLRKAIKADMHIDGHTLNVMVSIGVAHWTDDGTTLTHVLKVADERLYKAKSLGRNIVVAT
jgi:diguanylate cyclase (GGDEF)-like protein